MLRVATIQHQTLCLGIDEDAQPVTQRDAILFSMAAGDIEAQIDLESVRLFFYHQGAIVQVTDRPDMKLTA